MERNIFQKKKFLLSFMRPYGKPKQKPGHRQTSCAFLNMTTFAKMKVPNCSPMCLTDVYPLKSCVSGSYPVSSTVLTARISAAFSKDSTLLLPSQFSGENTEGQQVRTECGGWGVSLSHTFLFTRLIHTKYSMGAASLFPCDSWSSS